MNPEDLRRKVLDAILAIAPETDLATLDPAVPLRRQIEFDSMDCLNLVDALHERLGAEIPETEYARLATLDGILGWYAGHLAQAGPATG